MYATEAVYHGVQLIRKHKFINSLLMLTD